VHTVKLAKAAIGPSPESIHGWTERIAQYRPSVGLRL
jgi:hypothetical protein